MPLDLPTLLLVRLLIDGFLVALFGSFVRRQPTLGGPRWWAGAAIASGLSTLAAASVVLGGGQLGWLNVAGGLTAIAVSHALVWLGLRSYLGLSMQRAVRGVAVGGAAMFVVQVVLLEVWDTPGLRRAVFVAAAMALVVLSLRHLRRKGASNSAAEFHALRFLYRIELLVLGVVLMRLLYTTAVSSPSALGQGAPFVLTFMTLDSLVRTALLSALVVYRLQQVSERDRQKLSEGKADLRALIDNIHAGVIVFNPDRTIETINAAARHFLGRSKEPTTEGLQGLAPLDGVLLREDGLPMARHEQPFERVLATGRPMTDVILGMMPEGQVEARWALCNAFAENDHLGGLRHVVFTFVDITSLQAAQREQKVLQAQLSQSQKMQALGTLAGGVAHDFNNILAAILGNAELARQDAGEDSMAVQSLNEISVVTARARVGAANFGLQPPATDGAQTDQYAGHLGRMLWAAQARDALRGEAGHRVWAG